jgi:hypothetical protein
VIAQCDIFRADGDSVVWIEAVHDLLSAKKRLQEIGVQSPGKYMIVNHSTGNKLSFEIKPDGTVSNASNYFQPQ